jgi:hypothetical protein
MRFLKQNGRHSAGSLACAALTAGDDAHTPKEVYGEYVEAVNLLRGGVSAEQAEVGRRAYCLEAIAARPQTMLK